VGCGTASAAAAAAASDGNLRLPDIAGVINRGWRSAATMVLSRERVVD